MHDATVMALPLGFHEWEPVVQAAALAILTFAQEDAPTVSAALLSVTGSLKTATAFLGCFFGIWIGDGLLYWLARGFGRPLIEKPWVRGVIKPAAIARSEQWFARRGTWLLLASRIIPGTRLPTYLAAGFLRISFTKFLLVTGIAVALWTTAIFLLAGTFGNELVSFIQRWQGGGWALLLAVALLVIALRGAMSLANARSRRRIGIALDRATRWEFWPAWLFYLPVGVNYVRLALRCRSFTAPTAANPGMFSGGIVGESKIVTLRELSLTSPESTAEADLIDGKTKAERLEAFQALMAIHPMEFPVVFKPDVGQRGAGVKLICDLAQASSYLLGTDAPVICQRYAPGPLEAGVFYYRFPHESRGRIFAITEKIFPVVTGDGTRSIQELIEDDPRARLIADKYLKRFGGRSSEILPAGATLKLVEAGNHAQGCIFQDGMRLWSEELEQRIDEISRKLNGFFIGRYDIRYASEAELRRGENFQIVELNGAASEATSIYDARNSLWAAYRTLFRQWELVFAIGAANRSRGVTTTEWPLLWQAWRRTVALTELYPQAD